MTTTTTTTTDRWRHAGLDCMIMLCRDSHLCGYVRVPKHHPWHGKGCDHQVPRPADFDTRTTADCGMIDLLLYANQEDKTTAPISIALAVHGGVTFAGERTGTKWWFGFDLCHAGDDAIAFDRQFVIRECNRLAEQLAAVTKETAAPA